MQGSIHTYIHISCTAEYDFEMLSPAAALLYGAEITWNKKNSVVSVSMSLKACVREQRKRRSLCY